LYSSRRADQNLHKEDFNAALQDYNTAIRQAATNSWGGDDFKAITYFDRGMCRSFLEDYQGGIADISQAILLSGRDKPATYYYERGRMYHKLSNYSLALKNYDDAIEKNTGGTEEAGKYYCSRAEAHYHLKKYIRAVSDYTVAIESDQRQVDKIKMDLNEYFEENPDFEKVVMARPLSRRLKVGEKEFNEIIYVFQ
jgi:tetratricopeptide (TPR) repeat protein